MADGYYKKVSSNPAVAPNLSLTGINLAKYNRQVNQSTIKKEEQVDACIDLDEYIDIEVTYESHEEVPWYKATWNWVSDVVGDAAEVYTRVQATVAVGTTSVFSGISKISERFLDGTTWLLASGADIIGFDDAATNMREFIARDLVGEANQFFYENTNIGQAINNASYMKYDSKLAQGIQSQSEKVGTFIAATAISLIPGAGPALTALAGGLYQAGASAESTYQNGTDTSMLQELMILASGGLGALSWATNAKLGQGMINIYGQFEEIGWDAVQTALKFAFSKKTWNETSTLGNTAMNVLATLLQSGGDIATIATKIVNGEEVPPEEYGKLVGMIALRFGLNTLEDMVKSGIKQYNTAILNDNVAETLEAANKVDPKKVKPTSQTATTNETIVNGEKVDNLPENKSLATPVKGPEELQDIETLDEIPTKTPDTPPTTPKIDVESPEEAPLIHRIKGKNKNKSYDKIDPSTFFDKSIDEQISEIRSSNIYGIAALLNREDLSEEVVAELNNRLLKNQDLLFQDTIVACHEFREETAYFIKNPELLKQLSNENIVKALSNSSLSTQTELLEEAARRINNGDFLFDVQASTVQSIIGNVGDTFNRANDTLDAYDSSLWQKIVDNGKAQVDQYLPEELKALDLRFNNFYLVNLCKNGEIDQRAINIITKMKELNPKMLDNFDYRMLSTDMIDTFGEHFVKNIGFYPELTTKILSLKTNNQEAYNALIKVINNTYKDPSLNNIYTIASKTIDFLFENSEHLDGIGDIDSSILADYVLFNSDFITQLNRRVSVDLSNNFWDDLYQRCDEEFAAILAQNKSGNLTELKDIYFQKFFSISSTEAEALLTKYGDHLDEIMNSDDPEIQTYAEAFKNFRKILDINDQDTLAKLYNSQNVSLRTEEILALDDGLRLAYTKTFADALERTSTNFANCESKLMSYGDKQIKIIQSDGDFSLLVYSSDTGFTENKVLVDGDYRKTWESYINGRTHGLSTSYITSENIGSCPIGGSGVLYGFTEIEGGNIRAMGPYDVNSNIANYGFSTQNQQIYTSADQMARNTTRVYNEFVLDRNAVKPNYIVLYSDASETIRQNSLKAAADWDIPIVEINVEDLAIAQADRINTLTESFTTTKDISKLREALDVYESNVSGFKLNAVYSTDNVTLGTGHPSVAALFESTELEGTILDYIHELKTTNNTPGITELEEVLISLKAKYDIANLNGTIVVATTHSGIDIDTLLDLLHE